MMDGAMDKIRAKHSKNTKDKKKRPRLMVYSMLSFLGFSLLISVASPLMASFGGLLLLIVNLDDDYMFYITAIVFIIMYICASLFFVWLFAYFMNRKVLGPIDRLTNALRRITGGDRSTRLTGPINYEFEEMQNAFNYMAERLESAEKAKLAYENERSMIFSNISHDLKTPISTIAGYAGALSDGMVTDEEKKTEYLRSIQEKALHMNKLVELLFEYARIDNQQYELHCEKLDLTELLRELVASMYNDFESRSISVDIDLPETPVYFNGDRLELSRAIGNFLNNALNHNNEGNCVEVSFGIISPEDGPTEYQILVSDDGEAIPEELAIRLFTPFVVGDESRSSRGGSGLGLAITRKIVERHGGRATMLQGPDGFTKSFAIILPGEFSPQATAPQSNESLPASK
jgi:signal transduction histidine kinase